MRTIARLLCVVLLMVVTIAQQDYNLMSKVDRIEIKVDGTNYEVTDFAELHDMD